MISMPIRQHTNQRIVGRYGDGCNLTNIIVFCYDDMLRKGFYCVPERRHGVWYMPTYVRNILNQPEIVYKPINEIYNGISNVANNYMLDLYRDWPLRNVNVYLYKKNPFGEALLVDIQQTDEHGFVEFKKLRNGQYFLSINEFEFPEPEWNHIHRLYVGSDLIARPIGHYEGSNFVYDNTYSFEINDKTPRKNWYHEVGWCYDTQYKINNGIRPGYCYAPNEGSWMNDYYSMCVCGNYYGMNSYNYTYYVNGLICGYRQTNLRAQNVIGHYAGRRWITNITHLNGHIMAFDCQYSALGQGIIYYSDSIAVGLGLRTGINEAINTSSVIPLKSGATTGTYYAYSYMMDQGVTHLNGTVVELLVSCHGFCGSYPCYPQVAYYMVAETALNQLNVFQSMQDHFGYTATP